MAASLLILVPAIVFGERYRSLKLVFVGSLAALLAAQLGLLTGHGNAGLVIAALLLFFGAFNTLEASLPSLISKIAPVTAKGTAIGVYSSSQFLGIFVGGTVGGWAYGASGLSGVFTLTCILGLIWLALAVTMPAPPYYSSRTVNVGALDDAAAGRLTQRLNEIGGVVEAVILREDRTAHLKIDRSAFDETELENVLAHAPEVGAGSAAG
jgi:MFS family permease